MSTSESKKTKKPCKILSQECIGTDIYSMWLDAGEIGKKCSAGTVCITLQPQWR